MSPRIQTLQHVRARDIMQDRVVQLDPTTSIEEATSILTELNISGAPVVDAAGKLLGMISANDIARPENIDRGAVTVRRSSYEMGDLSGDDDGTPTEDVIEDMEDFSPEALRTGTVQDFMSPDVFPVDPESSVAEVSRLMLREHVHRVPVVESGKIVGIVSTLDIVRCVAES